MTTIPFHHESATASVHVVAGDLAFVHSLYSNERRKGHATEIMTQIINWADESAFVLLLTAQEYGVDQGLDNWGLIAFYERFGFRVQKDLPPWPKRMIRYPRKNYTPLNEKETLRRR